MRSQFNILTRNIAVNHRVKMKIKMRETVTIDHPNTWGNLRRRRNKGIAAMNEWVAGYSLYRIHYQWCMSHVKINVFKALHLPILVHHSIRRLPKSRGRFVNDCCPNVAADSTSNDDLDLLLKPRFHRNRRCLRSRFDWWSSFHHQGCRHEDSLQNRQRSAIPLAVSQFLTPRTCFRFSLGCSDLVVKPFCSMVFSVFEMPKEMEWMSMAHRWTEEGFWQLQSQ